VAARHGLQSRSFDKASELYSDSTGGSMSGDSVRRITEGFGQALEDRRIKEAELVHIGVNEQAVKRRAPCLEKSI